MHIEICKIMVLFRENKETSKIKTVRVLARKVFSLFFNIY